jgi:hypothetical protein
MGVDSAAARLAQCLQVADAGGAVAESGLLNDICSIDETAATQCWWLLCGAAGATVVSAAWM